MPTPKAAPRKRTTAPKAAKPAVAKSAAKKAVAKSTVSDAPKVARPRAKKVAKDARELTHDMARSAAQFALEKKATDVKVLDLSRITSMTDFFVIATGDSDRQVKAIAENVMVEMRDQLGQSPWKSEGWDSLKWVILDFVDFVVHVLQAEARTFYNIERMWADAPAEVMQDKGIKKKAVRAKKSPQQDEDDDTSRVRVISRKEKPDAE
jgi:ribosome-associated protein